MSFPRRRFSIGRLTSQLDQLQTSNLEETDHDEYMLPNILQGACTVAIGGTRSLSAVPRFVFADPREEQFASHLSFGTARRRLLLYYTGPRVH